MKKSKDVINKKLDIAILKFKFHRPISSWEGFLARGFFGNAFPSEVLAHHHLALDQGPDLANKLLYCYPLVQYKTLNGELLIIGIKEGIQLVSRFAHFESISFDSEKLPIVEAYFQRREEAFGVSKSRTKYQFITPWLALNEKNVKTYYTGRSSEEIGQMLSRILVGNILSMAKGLGYTAEDRICATVCVKERKCSLKGNPMLGFIGTFITNFKLPNYSGLGKSVSRGFGTIERISAKSDKGVFFTTPMQD